MKSELRERIKTVLESLYIVNWDRYIDVLKDSDRIVFYGWIERVDKYKDFIVVTFWSNGSFEYVTSSDHYSKEISSILFGISGSHTSCKRVEDEFSEVKNVIRLSEHK